jgi:peptidylprolyl isomerase
VESGEILIRKFFLYGLYILFLIELLLRAQQFIGPFYDLNPKVDFSSLSDVVNHQRTQTQGYDEVGVRRLFSPHFAEGHPSSCRVLFMGDSFMEGFSDRDSIPGHVWEYFKGFGGSSVEFLNAGCSSYSPLIFIPQFKRIEPVHQPSRVVLLIDETDFGDDFIRYRHLAVRRDGRVVAVKKTPVLEESLRGMDRLRRMPLYLMRFFYKRWFTRVHLPAVLEDYRKSTDERSVLQFVRLQEDPGHYKAETDFFEKNVDELVELIVSKVGPENLVLVWHPYWKHLTGQWRTNVRPVLERQARKRGVLFYDFTEDLEAKWKGDFARYYVPRDIHFNHEGLKLYGNSLAQFLEKKGFFKDCVRIEGSERRPPHMDSQTVVLETNQGTMEIKLMPEVAPKACENFTGLVRKGYYDGLIFHRTIKGFMIQGGDPTGTGRGGESIWGKPFGDEFDPSVQFDAPGILAMANAGPNTNGSQFFITTAKTPWLNRHHTIFGKVTAGYEAVQKIENTVTDPSDRPKSDQKIIKAYLKT